MKARSSSYHALPGRTAGHVRRTSRTSSDFFPTAQLSTNPTTSTNSHPSNTNPSAAVSADQGPSWNDFSPRGVALPPAPPRVRQGGGTGAPPKRPRDNGPSRHPPGAGGVLRGNKPVQRLFADARMAVKVRTKALFPQRVVVALAFLFISLVGILYALLKRTYGMVTTNNLHALPDAQSNAQRIHRGLPPIEYWPFTFRTRLKHTTPITKALDIPEVFAFKNRLLLRATAADYRNTGSKFPVRISLLAACKDRTAFLQSALPTWLDALGVNDEVIVVDWGTDQTHIPPMAVVEAMRDSRISVVAVRNVHQWVLTRAYNLALRHARGEWVLKVDCDTMLPTDFLQDVVLPREASSSSTTLTDGVGPMPPQPPHPTAPDTESDSESHADVGGRHYLRASSESAARHTTAAPSGVFLARSEDVRTVRGYDERVITYGWEDSDLYQRLEAPSPAPALTSRRFSRSVRHIPHVSAARDAGVAARGGPVFDTQVNRLALQVLGRWSDATTTAPCTYSHYVASNDGRFVYADVGECPHSAVDALDKEHRDDVLDRARDTLLHETYNIPRDVLPEIARSRAELVRELASVRQRSVWAPGTGVIFAEVAGSAAARVLGAAHAVALAARYKRPLFLSWRADDEKDHARQPRIDTVFDTLGASNAGAHVVPLGRWPCRYSTLAACADTDAAYGRIAEFPPDALPADVARVFSQRPADNVVFRLEGALPGAPRDELSAGLRALRLSSRLAEAIAGAPLADAHALYLGPRLRAHSVDAVARRLAADRTPFFVAGADRALVRRARAALDSQLTVDSHAALTPQELEFAELFALARCAHLVNDGRTPPEVAQLVAALRDAAIDR